MIGDHVTITDPARRAEFEKVFGTATVPVKSAQPLAVELDGVGTVKAYQLDLDAVGPDARARLISHLAEKFGVEDPGVVWPILMEQGLAILADDCIVAIDARLF